VIYSVGYEDRDVGSLAGQLAAAGVTVLVDVRLNAASRRPGFARRALAAALAAAGIRYVHERALGNPPDNRDSFRRGDGSEGRRRMQALLAAAPAADALARLVALARDERVAVLCVERDPARCHRTVVTDAVRAIDPAIEVVAVI
jgi:uncharacterized protein (DUF488 family)